MFVISHYFDVVFMIKTNRSNPSECQIISLYINPEIDTLL